MAQNPSGDDNLAGNVYTDMEGDVHANGTSVWAEGAKFRLGTPPIVTIVSGVATVTTGFVALAAESGTTDTVDTITVSGAVDGDLLLIVPDAGDTITIDDANINLGAATRALAPGGSMLLYYNATKWNELTFLAGADNA
jgi:hypothetical protein